MSVETKPLISVADPFLILVSQSLSQVSCSAVSSVLRSVSVRFWSYPLPPNTTNAPDFPSVTSCATRATTTLVHPLRTRFSSLFLDLCITGLMGSAQIFVAQVVVAILQVDAEEIWLCREVVRSPQVSG